MSSYSDIQWCFTCFRSRPNTVEDNALQFQATRVWGLVSVAFEKVSVTLTLYLPLTQ
jgi:hypothetical protein